METAVTNRNKVRYETRASAASRHYSGCKLTEVGQLQHFYVRGANVLLKQGDEEVFDLWRMKKPTALELYSKSSQGKDVEEVTLEPACDCGGGTEGIKKESASG